MKILKFLQDKSKIIIIILSVALVLSCCRNCIKKNSEAWEVTEHERELIVRDSIILEYKNNEIVLNDSISKLNERLTSANKEIESLKEDKRYLRTKCTSLQNN